MGVRRVLRDPIVGQREIVGRCMEIVNAGQRLGEATSHGATHVLEPSALSGDSRETHVVEGAEAGAIHVKQAGHGST
jgi:hypothetical protein